LGDVGRTIAEGDLLVHMATTWESTEDEIANGNKQH
jgi:hypothetical protein